MIAEISKLARRCNQAERDARTMLDSDRDARRELADAKAILAEMLKRTHAERVTGTGFETSGFAIDLTASVLLEHLKDPRAKNFASFEIKVKDEVQAIVTIQRPTGETPIERMRTIGREQAETKAKLEAIVERYEAYNDAQSANHAAGIRHAISIMFPEPT